MISQRTLMPVLHGQSVRASLTMSVTSPTVDHAGLMELLRLSMTVFVSQLEDLSPISFLLPTLLAAAMLSTACLSDAMEVRSELHGAGSRTLVLLLEETMVMEPSATTTPRHSA